VRYNEAYRMVNIVYRNIVASIGACLVVFAVWFLWPIITDAQNISQSRDVISDSAPSRPSNHTFQFTNNISLPPLTELTFTFPPTFEVLSTTTFSVARNVELYVNGTSRLSGANLTAAVDSVQINPGFGGTIVYRLNSTTGIPAGSAVELRVGNHTSKSQTGSVFYDDFLEATTTIPGDIKPIVNASTTGSYRLSMMANNGGQIARAGFVAVVIDTVGVGPADTTETDPPERFNGSPEGVIDGFALLVEVFLETNEFAICKYSSFPNVSYNAMSNTFTNTGLIFHTVNVSAPENATTTIYVRCVDDEGNFNIDDYEISFYMNARPAGQSNEDGDNAGDGSGTGDDGAGAGDQSGSNPGSGTGSGPTPGPSSGGSGGGGGGGGGGGSGGGGGGGFENSPGPFESGDGRIIISGTGPAGGRVFVNVDGREGGNASIGNNGIYEITVDGIARGAYTFGVYAVDRNGGRTSTFSTSFTVSGARASALSNIHIPPSLTIAPNPVNPGETVTLSGFTVPNATVTIENEQDGRTATRREFTVTAGANGAWTLPVDTTGFSVGTYRARVKSEQGSIRTNFSNFVNYGVGQEAASTLNADLNRDGRVNLTDFSILLFWWGTAGGNSNPPADINQDGRVNLTDFSILLFNWTG